MTTKTKNILTIKRLKEAHETIQVLREQSREQDRRSDAQHYADTQWLIREAIKTTIRSK